MNDNSKRIDEVVNRFSRIYLGDSLIEQIEIDIAQAKITLLCTSALLLRDVAEADIFDPERRFKPATLEFHGVRSLRFPEGNYYLNSTIVSFEAVPLADQQLVTFRFETTGG